MALDMFKFPPLPQPPLEWEPHFIKQFLRTLELYFSQLDSNTPNHAQQYTADRFIGGELQGFFKSYTTTEKDALTPVTAQVVFDTNLGKLCVYTGAAWETITSA
jgi:hypothetical protein